jgi:hypothetical protein
MSPLPMPIKTPGKSNTKFIDNYINIISTKCENHIAQPKQKLKITDDNIIIPTIHNYCEITNYNYNVHQLKSFAKTYKLKINGTKKELIVRLFTFLQLSSYIIKIQKVFRGNLLRKYNKIQGPGLKNRNICTNGTDFITMDDLSTIANRQFFSYTDLDGFTYGFDIASLYNLLFKNEKKVGGKNPYNRSSIPETVIINIRHLIKLSKILGIPINLQIEDDTCHISPEKVIELRALNLFQTINELGNYSDAIWFLSLNRIQLLKFIRELGDIWHYRAQLSPIIKQSICPPLGDPFRQLSINYVTNENNMNSVRKSILEVLEKMVTSGIDRDSKSLGAYYVLGALTLVNQSAALALPWLFQSVS